MAAEVPNRRREAAAVLADVRARKDGFTPTWTARPQDPALAVATAHASYLSYLWERLHLAADKNKLALLSELGIDRLPPAAARAPVAFEPLPGSGNAEAPAGSLVGGNAANGEQLTFRTEAAIGLTTSPLAEVWSVVPGRDTAGDHTADISGGRPARLFSQQHRTTRALYIGHDSVLAIAGNATISVALELAREAEEALHLVWSIWDGDVWREFLHREEGDPDNQVEDGTSGLTRSGTVRLTSDGIESAPTKVHGIESHWLRCELVTRFTGEARRLPEVDQVSLAVKLDLSAFEVERAVALGQEVDVTAPFFPFGQSPDRTTLFYVDASGAGDDGLGTAKLAGEFAFANPLFNAVTLAIEYWNGSRWRAAKASDGTAVTVAFATSDQKRTLGAAFAIPQDWAASEVTGLPGRWIRMRIDSGVFSAEKTIAGEKVNLPEPPTLSDLTIEVTSASPATLPNHVVTRDRETFRERTQEARYRGAPFAPFASNPDVTSALYLGFDGPLPAAAMGLYFDIEPPDDEPSHEFRWECYDGQRWVSLPVLEDETGHLTRTGIVRLLWPGNRPLRRVSPVAAEGTTATAVRSGLADVFVPGDEVLLKEGETGELATVAAVAGRVVTLRRELENAYQAAWLSEPEPPLFGTPRTWIRARIAEGGADPDVTIRRLVHNITWASEARAVENEILGSAGGRPNETMTATRPPILPGEVVQVRELTGARARTDLAILRREVGDGALETDTDPVTGDVDGVWVRWEPQANLLSSGADDRHYVVDRVAGTVRFGDGRRGRVPPIGIQNVRLRRYDTGGGRRGNLAAQAIETPLSGIVAQRVWNPVAASGGADAEAPDRAIRRAPRVVRHRYQAVTATDYRDVALEASPEVQDAAVVFDGDDLGGRVRLVVLPASDLKPPAPSAQLLERVRRHLLLRCPAGAVSRLQVVAPTFVPIGVDVVVAAAGDAAGAVFDGVRAQLTAFLHAAGGGPASQGWSFGTTVHVARFAPVLEAVPGVDFVESFSIMRNGAIVGDELALEPHQLPAAGDIRVRLTQEATR